MSEEFDGLAGFQHVPDQPRLGLGIGCLRARCRDLRIDVAKLLRRQRGVVVADKQARLGPVRFDLGLGLHDLLAQGLDLAGQHLASGLRLLLFDLALQLQKSVGDSVGDAGGKLRILRQEIDDDDARFFHREHGESVVIGVQHALFRRHAHRILDDAEHAEHGLDRRHAAERRIEFRQLVELELGDHVLGEVARHDELRLARHRLLVDGIAIDQVLVGFRTQKDIVARFDDDARFRLIAGRDDLDGEKRDQSDQDASAAESSSACARASCRAPRGPTPGR